MSDGSISQSESSIYTRFLKLRTRRHFARQQAKIRHFIGLFTLVYDNAIMVKRCCWGTCNTDSRYPDRLQGGIVFIPFPKPGRNLEKAKRWIRLCGRPHYQLNEDILKERGKAKHLYVCSKVICSPILVTLIKILLNS